MAGPIPPMPPPPSLPPAAAPDGLLVRLWNAIFPSAEIPDQPGADEPFWYQVLFRPWSLPARVAVFITWVLIAIVAFCLWEFSTNPYHVPWRYSLTPIRIISVSFLLLVIPLTVFQALKMWLTVEKSPFPDINAAWQAGIEALRKQGLTIGDKPLFLVLGSTGEEQDRVMFEASNSAFIVAGVPDGPAPLHWYVNADRIFLSCTGTSWLSALSALIAQRDKRRGNADGGPFSRSADESSGNPGEISALGQGEQFGGSEGDQSPFGAGSDDSHKTISFSSLAKSFPDWMSDVKGEAGSGSSVSGVGQEQSLAIIQPSDASEQKDRLEAVCELLRNARYPYCPINGCITLIPFATAGVDLQEIEEMSKAVNSDLQTLHKTLHVRYPVTAIFTGLEAEPGFRELMRRVGPEQCAAGRFGMGYDVRCPANASEIGTFATHVCGVFEEWVYGLFRQDQALKKPGNSSLFTLLCRVRSSFKDRLSMLLSQGFGYNDRVDPDDAPFLFSGCYFVASGATQDKRAFIQGISEKLKGQQDQLEWSREAIQSARRARQLAGFALVTIGVLAALLAYMIVYRPVIGH